MWRRAVVFCAVLAAAAASQTGPKLNELKKLVKVTSKNYDELMTTKSAVIFHVSEDDTFEGADALAKELEGLVRVASINTASQRDLIDKIKKEKDINLEEKEWFVKGYGADTVTAHSDLATARKSAEDSNPDDTVTVIKTQQEIQQFLSTSYAAVKVGLILFHNKNEVPALLTKLSLWLGDDFAFASYANPPEQFLKGMGQEGGGPVLLAFVPQEDKDGKLGGQIQFGPAPYDKARFGALKFKNVFKFGMVLRMELGQMGFYDRRNAGSGSEGAAKESPKAKGNTKTQPLFEYTAETPDACDESKLGLCVFGIIDGSPMNDAKEAQLQVLRDSQTSPSSKGRVLHFMWVDLTCHPAFGERFGISLDNLPAVVAVSPKKQAWAQHFGGFESTKVSGFIGGVLGGRVRISKLPEGGVPTISADDDCAAVHGSMMPVEEEDVPLDDIMAEMQAEAAEAKAKEEEDNNDLEEQAADAEMAAKRKRAEAEAARMNGVSNKDKKKKKKKKRKTKKKKAKKDEL